METIQELESRIQQKSEPEVDEMPGSMDDQKAEEISQDTVMESDTKPAMQTELETSPGANPNPAETNHDTNEVTYGDPGTTTDPGATYRCKRCRTLVATEGYVVTHKVGCGQKSFAMRRKYDPDEEEPECTCLFVQPLKWMQPFVEGYVSGKIACRKCNTRLGEFHWAGMQCSCGAWVNPAFKLVNSRIDKCEM
ncbi:probable inactive dual specificity protein phosphatase-like At4g18593 [Oryza brachyantha]|uniref:Uncharacterized protein n=1 Tax=Oryza brachyantha TaxID=4533 RepID=J3LBE4_ORYBR|nr:probable inactive dual specificity protein phosphatase-like At4g18593 [Oryza brachyantha]